MIQRWAIAFFLLATFSGSAALADPASADKWEEIKTQIAFRNPNIPQNALDYAFSYLAANEESITNQNYMTIINFDLPSTDERMSVIDLNTLETKTYLVAHGKNSGMLYATTFSNIENSNMSSLGIYLAGEPYIGSHGLSMRLRGMEESNNKAESRAIVMHSADYVSYDFINTYGRLGRSWGCPAVNPLYSEQLVKQLQNGSIFYIYRSPSVRNHYWDY